MEKLFILLVDDDPTALVSISRDIEKQGYSVTSVDSGSKAINFLKAVSFDLVITDLIMEPVNGIEVLEKAKAMHPEIKVMVLTGHGDMSSVIKAFRAGVDDYLFKPYDPEELLFRIKSCAEKLITQKKLKAYENVVPMCCVCKKIRDDTGKERGKGVWIPIEEFFVNRTNLNPSHGYCPECLKQAKKELEEYDQI